MEPTEEPKDQGGALFDEETDGGAEQNILTITIEADADGEKRYHGAMASAAERDWVNWDNVAIGRSNWKDQFVEAMYVNGSAEEQAEASVIDWFFHIISLPWKVFFAIVPPVDFCGGWLCFCCALGMIGFCTAIISDMANLLGCALDMKASITAITFVALGTSLPDTFASKTAAMQDPTADNSIGNVTGSNSVNVFLGLGMPWAIGSIYWAAKGAKIGDEWYQRGDDMGWPAQVKVDFPNGAFVVPAGNLGSSVGVFCGCAVTCIGILMARRVVFGAELGGPKIPARISSCVMGMLWFVYIAASVAIEGGFSPY